MAGTAIAMVFGALVMIIIALSKLISNTMTYLKALWEKSHDARNDAEDEMVIKKIWYMVCICNIWESIIYGYED